jgi:DNA-binding response OmpR family regulator
MARSARTLPFPNLNSELPDSSPYEGNGDHHDEAALVVLVGRVADDQALLHAARRADAVTLVAPDLRAARAWLTPNLPQAPSTTGDDRVTLDGLVVNLRSHEARWRGMPLDLTAQEIRLLAVLAEEPATAWSFAALGGRVWGSSHPGDRSMIRSAIYRLRRKLNLAAVPTRILSVRGVGFRLVHSI